MPATLPVPREAARKRVKGMAGLVLDCLSFDLGIEAAALEEWARLPEAGHQALLRYSDRAGLTLHLWQRAGKRGVAAGPAIASLYEERARKNRIRLERAMAEADRLLELLAGAGLRVALLKGFALEPEFVESAEDRVQYDLDFCLAPHDCQRAFDLLCSRGMHPLPGNERADHLPPLITRSGWQWRGDYFDPDIPLAVEMHFRLWDADFERIAVGFNGEPLERLALRAGRPVLHDCDQLAYHTLHLLRHLFRGSLRPAHLYECAYFLGSHPSGHRFWDSWLSSVNAPLRSLCAGGFLMAASVFGAPPASELAPDIETLPRRARTWMERYAPAAVHGDRSSKEELLLQLCFVRGWRDRAVVAARRLAPLSLPGPVDAVHLRPEQMTLGRRVLSSFRQARYVLGRAAFHVRSLAGFLAAAARWAAS